MNKKRMKWIFFILTLTCFPVVLVYANGAPMPGANNFNTNTPASNTGTGAPQPGANGFNTNTSQNNSNTGYAPPNIQEAQAREAQNKKKKEEKKKKDEKKIEKDDDYQSIQQKAENVDKILKNKNASTKDIKKAGKDIEDINKYVEQNKDKEDASQIQELKTTQNNYNEQVGSKLDDAKAREEAQEYLNNARKTVNPADLSKLTSYMYVEGGFFNSNDIFPKVVNAIAQGIFFLVKAIYCLVIIILEQVFTANTYKELDKVVGFSANFFNTFMTDYKYLVYGLALFGGLTEFFKTRRFPIWSFRFLLVWFVAALLYQPASFQPNYGDSQVPASYNLSVLVKMADGLGQDMTSTAIKGFDTIDADNATLSSQNGKNNIDSVKNAIFDKLVYEPFLALNFTSSNKDDIPLDKVKDLFATKGDPKKVEDFAKENEKIEQVSFGSVGVKIFTALAALIKSLVIGFALIVIGLISIVFKYLALLMIVCSVILLFIAMIPGCEQVLGNAGKKLMQFALLGGLGLFFVRAFLFVNGLIEGAAGGMNDIYFWSAIIQGLIWFVLYRCRHLLGGLFVKGTISAQELAQKAQFNFDRFSMPKLSTTTESFGPSQTVRPTNFSSDNIPVASPQTSFKKSLGTLFRAGKNGTVQVYDRLIYGKEDTLDKQLSQQRRADFKRQLQDRAEGLQDLFAGAKGESLRAKVHDLAGDTDTPVQLAHQEREYRKQERLERIEKRQQDSINFDRFRDERRRNMEPGFKNEWKERLSAPKLKREWQKQQYQNNPADELFEKGVK